MKKFLVKLNRWSGYILFPTGIFMFILGYRMSGSFVFINRGFADLLHKIYLNVLFVFLFFLHSLLSLRFALMRKNLGSVYLDVLFVLLGLGMAGYFSYLSFRLILPP